MEILEPVDKIGEKQTAHFMVTKSKRYDSKKKKHVASEVWVILDRAFELNGGLQTSVLKRRLN